MKKVKVGGLINTSAICMGMMRIDKMTVAEVESLVKTALDNGIDYFDHADIYGNGKCEEIFGNVIKDNRSLREKMIIQTKCGIRNGYYDFSKKHIIESVDNSLKRLNTDYIDVLLLHRPDTLMEPHEVNEAFEELYRSGRVRHFGVSNHNVMQIELFRKYISQPLIINQLQLSVMSAGLISSGMNVNMENKESVLHNSGLLEYSRLNDITIQAWSPFQYGFFDGVFLDNEKFPELNNTINNIAKEYGVTNTAIATAWILRHPANFQVVTGTVNPQRIKQICDGSDIVLTREQWYEIYRSAGHNLP